MKLFFQLFIVVLTGCYTPVKVRNLETYATTVVQVNDDVASLLVSGDTVIFSDDNADLTPSQTFVGVVIQEAMAITLDYAVNPVTGDTIPSGTILPCISSKNTGDIIFVSALDGDIYVESYDGIRCVFVK